MNIGLIGCGVISDSHAAAFRLLPGVDLRWACDLIPSRADRLSRAFDISRTTTRYLDVLDDSAVEAVSICTDHASHADIAVAALERGKHVLCEKALALDGAGLRRMLRAHTARPDLVFSGVFQRRFDRIYRVLRRWISEERFGKLLTLHLGMVCLRTPEYYRADSWRGTWAGEGGSVLINQAIHFIDLFRWLGGEIETLSGAYANLTHGDSIETEDTATASLEFASGALGTIGATCSSPISFEPTFSIAGTRGSVDLRAGHVLRIWMEDSLTARSLEQELEATTVEPALAGAKDYYGTGHAAQIADFADAIRSGHEPFVSARSAAETVQLVLAWYASHRSGQRVRPRDVVPIEPERLPCGG